MCNSQGQSFVFDSEDGTIWSLDLLWIQGHFKNAVSSTNDVHIFVESLSGGGWKLNDIFVNI